MKKIKKYFVYGFLSIFVLPLVILTSTASAYEGSRTSATQKEWFYVLEGCARQPLAYRKDANAFSGDFWSNAFGSDFLLNPSNARSGNWFGGASTITPNKNPYVEAQVEGSYGDGQFYCGQNDNALTKRAAKSIGFADNYEEVICSGDNFKDPGLLTYNVEGTCHGAYTASDSSGTYFTNRNSIQHLVDVANEKIDSTADVRELSSLERYFVRHDAFKYACVKGASPLEYAQTKAELEGTYPYVIYENHDGVAEYAGYNEAGNISKTTYVNYFYDEGAQCQEIAAALGEQNAELDEYLADKGGTQEDTDAEDACYNAGLDSVSYIVCPAINNTTSVVDTIEDVLRTLLEVNPNNTFSSETYSAWEIFRNISNIFLIIILMVIIFSQLTGYGIDNYGIKKMLPRLIAIAIIINLSYVICELAVDLSNILGSGLYELFKGIGTTINAEAASSDAGAIVTGILGALGGASVPIAGAVIAGVAAGGGVMIVISLVLLLLVALVAVVIVFLMLGVRMIIVILFVAVSPVAFALYILPNTQNFFKKYWKVAEAALVVFPICGAVCGISFIIRAIIFSSTAENDVVQIVTALVGLCAPFLPFFLLPNLLRGVLGGLGAIGGVLSGIGNGLRRGTQSLGDTVKTGVRNSEGFKNAANRRAENRQFRWAERNRNSSNANTRRKAQTLLNERTQQRALDTVGVMNLDTDTAQRRAEAARDATEYKAAQDQYAGYRRDELLRAAGFTQDQNGNYTVAGRSNILGQPGGSQRMRALISEMESRGMESNIYSMLQQNNVSNDEAIMSSLAGSNNKVLKAYGKKGAGLSYNDFMDGTGGQNANSMQKYIQSKGKEFVNGIDDKALAEIARTNPDAISTDQLVAAAASVNDADSLAAVNKMIGSRRDISISGKQLASYDESTIRALSGNSIAIEAILQASDDIANNQELINTLNPGARKAINELRGKGYGGRTRNMI